MQEGDELVELSHVEEVQGTAYYALVAWVSGHESS